MRALLTGGIKAILAIAALSTAAHWAMRVQREAPGPAQTMAGLPDPVSTGSIEPRKVERPAAASAPVQAPVASGLDQTHLAALMAGAAPARPRPQKIVGAEKAAPTPAKAPSGPAKAAVPAKVVASADNKPVARR